MNLFELQTMKDLINRFIFENFETEHEYKFTERETERIRSLIYDEKEFTLFVHRPTGIGMAYSIKIGDTVKDITDYESW